MNVWIFAELVLMTRQVSDPYSSTDFTLELKILSLVLVEIVVVFHTGAPCLAEELAPGSKYSI